jgi:hypothetical protein
MTTPLTMQINFKIQQSISRMSLDQVLPIQRIPLSTPTHPHEKKRAK